MKLPRRLVFWYRGCLLFLIRATTYFTPGFRRYKGRLSSAFRLPGGIVTSETLGFIPRVSRRVLRQYATRRVDRKWPEVAAKRRPPDRAFGQVHPEGMKLIPGINEVMREGDRSDFRLMGSGEANEAVAGF